MADVALLSRHFNARAMGMVAVMSVWVSHAPARALDAPSEPVVSVRMLPILLALALSLALLALAGSENPCQMVQAVLLQAVAVMARMLTQVRITPVLHVPA